VHFPEPVLVVNCHPDIARMLQGEEREELRYLMDRFNKTIQIRSQSGYHQEQFDLYGRQDRGEAGPGEKRDEPRGDAPPRSEPRGDRNERGGGGGGGGGGGRDRGGRGGRDRNRNRGGGGERGGRGGGGGGGEKREERGPQPGAAPAVAEAPAKPGPEE
jgi:ribonuclease G